MEIILLKAKLVERIWGGSRLKTEWGYEAERDDELGECWAVSCNKEADSEVLNGEYKGRKLSDLWEHEPQLFGRKEASAEVFPLLVKIIDAKDDLSIQVHPDDAYAAVHENSKGKRECWYILDCPEGAQLIVGNKAKDKAELEAMIRGGRWEELLNRIPVSKGDFVQIDPGTLHAITGGIELLEVQQNSDVTYRVYDYDRLQNGKPRQLHVEQSIAVTNAPNRLSADHVVHTDAFVNELQQLVTTPDYKVWTLPVDGECSVELSEVFLIGSVIEGSGSLGSQSIKKGDHFIVPHGYGPLAFTGSLRVNLAAPV